LTFCSSSTLLEAPSPVRPAWYHMRIFT
jgi:hypothetical protein